MKIELSKTLLSLIIIGSPAVQAQKNIVFSTMAAPDIDVNPTSLTIHQTTSSNANSPSYVFYDNSLRNPVSQYNQNPDEPSEHKMGSTIPESVVAYWKTHEYKASATMALPAVLDWSINDSPVKSQGSCGSCWAFAATAYIENLGSQNDLSEQVVVSCSGAGNCETGGYYRDALLYFQSTGVPAESCYPYTATNGVCANKCTSPDFKEKITTVSNYLWGVATVTNLRNQLQNGPLVVHMLVPEGGVFNGTPGYTGGIFNYSGGNISSDRGHAVLLVGYDDNQQCFKVKNSWGAWWGESGYFRIAYDDVTDDVEFGSYAVNGTGVYTQNLNPNSFIISNFGDASLSVSSVSDNADWLSLSGFPTVPFSILPSGTQYVAANVNWSLVGSVTRTATITITSNDPDEPTVLVPVTAIPLGCSLSVTPLSRSVASTAGSTTFTITSGCSWTSVSDQTWCTVSPASGTGNGTINVNYTANTTGASRNATITLTVPGLTPVTITVIQGACTMSVTPASRTVSSTAGSTSFTLTTTCAWTATSNQSWCTVSPPSGAGNGTLTAGCTANTTGTSRNATITVSVAGLTPVTVTVIQDACTTTVTPLNRTVSAAAGSTSFTLTSSCAWTATSDQSWCTVSPASGTGNGTITAIYTDNTTCSTRTATIRVGVSGPNPVDVTVTQAPCSLSVSTGALNVGCTAGTASFSIITNCAWSVSSDQNWCTVTPVTGNGNATVNISFTDNPLPGTRTAILSVSVSGCNPVPVTVTQVCACSLAVTPENHTVTSASGSVGFNISSTCTWTTTSDQSWCVVSPASGTGNSTFTASYAANTSCTSRVALIRIEVPGLYPAFVSLTQAPCSLTVSPLNLNAGSAAGTVSFTITSTCSWTITSDQTWCSVLPSAGNGNAVIDVSLTANTSSVSRTANLTISAPGCNPVVVTVTQEFPCLLDVTPASQNVPATGNTTSFAVTTQCDWNAASNQAWCVISPASGTGNGTITATMAANTSGSPRIATITVTSAANPENSRVVTVIQSGGCCQPAWAPIQNQLNNMTIICKLYLDNVLSVNPCDAIGVFAGQECRGIGHPDPDHGGIIFLTPTSNVQSGETLTFKAWNSAKCEECSCTETIPFVSQSEMGTMANPFGFHCGSVRLCIPFAQGYNWFSVNVNPGSLALNDLFGNLSPCVDDRIIGQTSFATWYSGQWIGSLTSIDPKLSYKMKLCSAQTWCKDGSPAGCNLISLPQGYTWTGYCPQTRLAINHALAGMTPQPCENDRMISQTAFATWYGQSWIGSLDTLKPGKGYIAKLCNSTILTYPSASGNSSATMTHSLKETETLKEASVNQNMRYNMQVIGNIILPNGQPSLNENDIIYAYTGNTCRGFARPVRGLEGRLFLTIQSDVEIGEILTLKVLLAAENRIYDIREKLAFTSEKELGTMENPFSFNISATTGVPVTLLPSGIRIGEIYPNPFDATASLEIHLDKPGRLEGKVINALGQLVKTVNFGIKKEGSHQLEIEVNGLSMGFYSLVLTYSNDTEKLAFTRKMIIK